MAAAVALVERGIPVTLYEAARDLGGRARRVVRNGQVLDNGQHILIGAYRHTLDLIERVGTPAGSLLRMPLQWAFPPHFALRCPQLPAPWHLALGLLRAQGMSAGARLGCARFFLWCGRHEFRLSADTSVTTLLTQRRQHASAIRFLWEPLCIAALNTPPGQASAQVFLNVLRDGVAGARTASDLVLPRVDLTSLFPAPAAEYIVRRGATVHLGRMVTRIEPSGERFMLATHSGAASHSAVIVATQPTRVASLAGHIAALAAPLRQIEALAYQPIVTLYLRFAQPCALPLPMLGMSGGVAQWVFDRAAISGQAGLLAVVISARARDELDRNGLARAVQRELGMLVPELGTPEWIQVIEEKRATFSCTPGLHRPDQRTGVRGLFLAGDYTRGDYPATLEAAVQSGLRCAELAAEEIGA
ncbi:MAG: FAD-dependent oxidoreductase [Burkholderiales bacterium]|nr:FAD-dependent oxidoreductase [Burkholderiales bacterium]